MAKAKTEKAEQLQLIDVEPENAKVLRRIAKKYLAAEAERKEWLAECNKQKSLLVTAIHDAGIHADGDGSFKIDLGAFTLRVVPNDISIKIKQKGDDGDDDDQEGEAEE
ncbi:MAG: hypothetical protein ACKV2Q_36685 [Planctomycetaceae bacterium]